MLKRVLVANRGEIAVRIIRACRDKGIETVAVYSTADANSLHTQLATTAVCIGKAPASESYLNANAIIAVALATKCDSLHPGYGFLSENSDFARMCEKHSIKFIGPSADIIDNMGNKSMAREMMIKASVPVVPGSDGVITSLEQAYSVAEKIGYPVLIKASAGGGGRGMRKVFHKEELETLLSTAKAEAMSCFGDDSMYMEKLIINPKHIEFQILADTYGNVIHLGERDCSLQRRGQKMMEESPSISLSPELRQRMGEDAVKAARTVGYIGAGTIEFVVDSKGNYFFIEMNTRIQVEHPVTEMRTGMDLIYEQLRIAAGLPISNLNVEFSGHVIECRINSEDPTLDFRPSSGEISFIHFPGGYNTRIESAMYPGCTVSPFYDSMIAKIIVKGDTRLEAIRRMRRALEEMVVEGVATNASLQHLIMHDKDIIKGTYDTGFIENKLSGILNIYETVRGKQ